ncbi:hypothetical protein C9975_08915, partial [Thalassospira xiamenensis]
MNSKSIILLLALTLLVSGCSSVPSSSASKSHDSYLKSYVDWKPSVRAYILGPEHKNKGPLSAQQFSDFYSDLFYDAIAESVNNASPTGQCVSTPFTGSELKRTLEQFFKLAYENKSPGFPFGVGQEREYLGIGMQREFQYSSHAVHYAREIHRNALEVVNTHDVDATLKKVSAEVAYFYYGLGHGDVKWSKSSCMYFTDMQKAIALNAFLLSAYEKANVASELLSRIFDIVETPELIDNYLYGRVVGSDYELVFYRLNNEFRENKVRETLSLRGANGFVFEVGCE